LGTPGNTCKGEELAPLLYAEEETRLSRCHLTFWSRENLAALGAAAAFAGALARRGAVLLHAPSPLPPQRAATRGVSNPHQTCGVSVFCAILTAFFLILGQII